MDNKHMKRWSTSLMIKGMQITTAMRHHLLPVRMTITNKSTNTSAGENVEKREPFCTVGGSADWCSHHGKQHGDISKN